MLSALSFFLVAFCVINVSVANAKDEQYNVTECSPTSGYCQYDDVNLIFDCSYSECNRIPSAVPFEAYEVRLKGNEIQTIDTTLSGHKFLQTLDLSENKINVIEKDALPENLITLNLTGNNINLDSISKERVFEDLKDLEYLYLANNKLENLTIPSIFSPWLSSIKHLDLSGNQIQSVGHNVLTDMQRLEILDLSGNQIMDPDSHDFLGLRNLKLLNLTRNQLKSIPDLMFKGMETLRTADLSENLIASISENSFEEADSLESLHLERNLIQVIPSAMCKHLKNLKSLFLDENPLKEIEYGSLSPTLQNISIQNCKDLTEIGDVIQYEAHLNTVIIRGNAKLAKISEFAFGKTTIIDHLDLSYNALTTLPEQLVAWDNVTSVNLAGNRWDCDCKMGWVTTLPDSHPVLKSLKCYNPLPLKGRMASELENYEFSCNFVTRYRSHGAIVLAIAVTVVLVTSVATILRRYRHVICRSWYPVGKYETLYSSAEASADDDISQPVTIKKAYTSVDEPVSV